MHPRRRAWSHRGAALRGGCGGHARHLNSGIEAHVAGRVLRTKVGSPFVIAGMAEAAGSGAQRIVGFEANGGTLTASVLTFGKAELAPLPTRDSVLPVLAALAAAQGTGTPLSGLVARLALPVAASGRLENFPSAAGRALVEKLSTDEAARRAFFAPLGTVAGINLTDGLRVTLGDGSIIHLRPSETLPNCAATPRRKMPLLRTRC